MLRRPEIPLHNNLSENDLRDYVKKRKISATTRSDAGQQARDTMLSLKKTCQKLGLSFWRYLLDRVSQQNDGTYLIFFREVEEAVRIERIIHGARRLAGIF